MTRRRAFTMVEMVVVIAIIAILGSLLVLGVGHLQRAAKARQTEQVLANLQGMFGDWDAISRVPFSSWAMPCPMNVTQSLNPPGDTTSPPMQADDGKVGNRYGAVVWVMRDLMFNLKSVPNNATAIAKLPADETMAMPLAYDGAGGFPTGFGKPAQWTAGTYVPAKTGTPYTLARVYVPDSSDGTIYVYYDCIQAHNSANSNAPPNAAYWLPAYPTFTASGTKPGDNTVPIPLDGWGNPIIFVPGGVLGVDPATYSIDAMAPNKSIDAGSGGMAIGGNKGQVRSPDGRPFFASAGPDGDFSLGDDNLYSYEH